MAEIIYIVDPLPDERRRIVNALAGEPVVVMSYDDAAQFLDQVATTASGCVLVPLDLPGMGLRALMDEIKRRRLPLAVVVLGRDSEFAIAVELVRYGAFDFLEPPFQIVACDRSCAARSARAPDRAHLPLKSDPRATASFLATAREL
jgi:FixJ family two-component response regulator